MFELDTSEAGRQRRAEEKKQSDLAHENYFEMQDHFLDTAVSNGLMEQREVEGSIRWYRPLFASDSNVAKIALRYSVSVKSEMSQNGKMQAILGFRKWR